MQAGYFKTAWNDVKNSPGWFGKVLLLALIALIPIFGPIVVAGYLFGWARDIAWGIHGPLPQHVFGNEDGKLYSRGFFVLVIGFVFALLPWAIEFVWAFIMGFGSLTFGHGGMGNWSGLFMFGGLLTLVFTALTVASAFVAMLFQWVGAMRMSIYGRLSAGFQFNKMWAMIRRDFGGLLRIFGMSILLSIILSLILYVVLFVLIFVIVFIGVFATGGNLRADYIDGNVLGWILAFGGISIIGALLVSYVVVAAVIWIEALVVRALGYWTRQFDVPAWRGQDDPMPFELKQAAARQANQPYNHPSQPYAGQPPVGQPYPHQDGQQGAPFGQQPYGHPPTGTPGAPTSATASPAIPHGDGSPAPAESAPGAGDNAGKPGGESGSSQ